MAYHLVAVIDFTEKHTAGLHPSHTGIEYEIYMVRTPKNGSIYYLNRPKRMPPIDCGFLPGRLSDDQIINLVARYAELLYHNNMDCHAARMRNHKPDIHILMLPTEGSSIRLFDFKVDSKVIIPLLPEVVTNL
jgi:hypothetical protein